MQKNVILLYASLNVIMHMLHALKKEIKVFVSLTSNHSPRGSAGLNHVDKKVAHRAIIVQANIISTPTSTYIHIGKGYKALFACLDKCNNASW